MKKGLRLACSCLPTDKVIRPHHCGGGWCVTMTRRFDSVEFMVLVKTCVAPEIKLLGHAHEQVPTPLVCSTVG